ncbi:carboxymuconolactone decarboxylase family protein [soil metagenome]
MAEMARVPYPDPDRLLPATQAALAQLPALNIFAMLAGGEGVLRAFTRLGNHLLFKSSLDPMLRELVILRVGALSGARYEVHQHEAIARRLGMSEALVVAVRGAPDDPDFDEMSRLVVRFTDDVVANVRAGDDTFEPLRNRLTLQQLEELTITIGYYMAVCRFLETFGVDIEDTPPAQAPERQ